MITIIKIKKLACELGDKAQCMRVARRFDPQNNISLLI